MPSNSMNFKISYTCIIRKWYAKPLSELNNQEESCMWKHYKSR